MLDIQAQRQVNAIASNWRLTPATLAHKLSNGAWIPAHHLRYISLKIAQAISKGGGRIIISLPPRHGKSELASVYTPIWTLENFPRKRVILASYGADLSIGFGRRVRDSFIDEELQDLLRVRLNPKSLKVSMFHTTFGGYMASVGVGGPITGRGADVLLIDDYIKEVKEALSPAYREYIWNWFVTTAYTRLEPGGTCIIIATRWHTDDLIGRILAELPGWEYIEIPAIAERHDILGRKEGTALFNARYPIETLEDRRRTLGTIWFNALFQQKPMDETNKIADSRWFHEEHYLPDVPLRFVRVWDFAATEGGGDYTTGTKMAYDRRTDHAYVVNVKREQVSPQQAEKLILKTAAEDGLNCRVGLEREPGAAGKSLVSHYQNNILKDFTTFEVPTAGTKKLIRAQPFLAAAEAGNVTLIAGRWNGPFKAEFDTFPGGLNDDQVDTASAAYNELTGKKVFTATWGRKAPSQKNTSSKAIRRAQISMKGAHHGTTIDRRTGKVIPIRPEVTRLVRGVTWGRRNG